jgi:hypothetical protein
VLEILNDFKESAKYKNIDLKMCCTDQLDLNGYKQSLGELMVEIKTIQTSQKDDELEEINA